MPRYEPDDEDEDDLPRRRSRRPRDDDDDDDEEDYRPRRNRPGSGGKPGMATTAGVLWAIWGVICTLSAGLIAFLVVQNEQADQPPMPDVYTPTGCCSAFLVLLTAGVCGFAAFFTLTGKAKSLTLFAVLSVVFPVVVVLARTVMGFVVGVELVKDTRGPSSIPMSMAFRSFLFSALLMSGVAVAGLLAFLANGRYREWKRTDRRRR